MVDNGIYDRHAESWWAEDGVLHGLRATANPARVGYIRRVLADDLRLRLERLDVLDVGCGGGFIAEELARFGCRVTGVDPSAGSLEAARRHARRERLDITYVEGRGEALPVPSNAFDVVCCCDVLEHVDDVEAVVREIARALRPGGVFLFDTINRTPQSRLVVIRLMQEWAWTRFVPPGLHDWSKFLTPDELDAAMRSAGLLPRGVVGLAPAVGPVAMLRAIRQLKRGRITYAEFGRRAPLREVRSTAVGYIGYAVDTRRVASRPATRRPSGSSSAREAECVA